MTVTEIESYPSLVCCFSLYDVQQDSFLRITSSLSLSLCLFFSRSLCLSLCFPLFLSHSPTVIGSYLFTIDRPTERINLVSPMSGSHSYFFDQEDQLWLSMNPDRYQVIQSFLLWLCAFIETFFDFLYSFIRHIVVLFPHFFHSLLLPPLLSVPPSSSHSIPFVIFVQTRS